MPPFGTPQPFPSGGHLLGQPFTVKSLGIPVNVVFTCNCIGEGATELTIVGSTPVTCPQCQTAYNAFLNPNTGAVQFSTQKPEKAVVS